MVACAEPRSKIPTLSEGVAQHPRRLLVSFLGLARTYIEQTRGISHSPSPLLLTTDDCPPVSDYYWIKSFRCNTYRSPRKCCKQKTYGLTKPFRCNTYKKHGVASFKPDIFLYPLPADCPPIFHLPYTLPSSVSRKPFIYHSYANTGVYGYSSHFGIPPAPSKPACGRVLLSALLLVLRARKRAGNDRADP
jgi:hypothetical protein